MVGVEIRIWFDGQMDVYIGYSFVLTQEFRFDNRINVSTTTVKRPTVYYSVAWVPLRILVFASPRWEGNGQSARASAHMGLRKGNAANKLPNSVKLSDASPASCRSMQQEANHLGTLCRSVGYNILSVLPHP